jgi:hypothetical protein
MPNNLESVVTHITDVLCDNTKLINGAHDYACDELKLPHNTTFGGNPGESIVSEEDPRYSVYWSYYSAYTTAILARVMVRLGAQIKE